MPTMTPVKTRGNFCGSRIDSATGRINPIPSNAKTAVLRASKRRESALVEIASSRESQRQGKRRRRRTHPIKSGKSFELNSSTSAIPRLASKAISFEKMYIKPTTINTSATSAVPDSFWMLRIRAKAVMCPL